MVAGLNSCERPSSKEDRSKILSPATSAASLDFLVQSPEKAVLSEKPSSAWK